MRRSNAVVFSLATLTVFLLYRLWSASDAQLSLNPHNILYHPEVPSWVRPAVKEDGRFHWVERYEHNPVISYIPIPTGRPKKIPQIQHKFPTPSTQEFAVRRTRQRAVKEVFKHAWKGYVNKAWMKDELTPVTGESRNTFGGWAATLVDSLDTLWIMDLKEDFDKAVGAVSHIDFSATEDETLNVFETTIRYIGGLLSAYDLCEGKYPNLLDKAVELGDMIYAAFDTPNRMPLTRWNWKNAATGEKQKAGEMVLLAEIGSLTLEFTRLTQLTGDPKFFDAVQRIMDKFEEQQQATKMPGLWPIVVDAKRANFTGDNTFSLGAMADSLYEYFPKQHLLLGGRSPQSKVLYTESIKVAKKNIFFRPMTPTNAEILISGNARIGKAGDVQLEPVSQHLSCFVGGMVAIGSRIFTLPNDMAIAQQLVDGCIWAYESMDTGIMPEVSHLVPCRDVDVCKWNEYDWHSAIFRMQKTAEDGDKHTKEWIERKIESERLKAGYADISDRRYILRPEAIESIFILYRITGAPYLQEKAWEMFQVIQKYTHTPFGNAALADITVPEPVRLDSMESFWTAETLKYFYLIFAEPDTISLDDFVFNTEAHPFRRPK